jgi:CHAT domain-containing protein/Tfp pilus assembly protein PilF
MAMGWRNLLVVAALWLVVIPAQARPPNLHDAQELQAETRALIDAGKYDDAIVRGERALAIRERLRRGNHPEVAESLDMLGEAWAYKNDFGRAEKLLSRALDMRTALVGKDHLDVATTLDKLAWVHLHTGRFESAGKHYDRVLRIRETKLGQSHELVAETLGNLGALYYMQARYQQAEASFLRAIEVLEAAKGHDAAGIAAVASNLGSLYSKLGRLDDAERQYGRALAIQDKHLGGRHPDYASTLNKLGKLALGRSDLVRATKLLETSLAIWQESLGPEHTRVGVALANLAEVYDQRGERERAKELLARAYRILKRLGESHPDAVQALHNYALLLAATGDPAAEEHLFRLVEIRQTELARGDVRAADTLLAVAQFALRARRFGDAHRLAQMVIDAASAKLGPDHLFVAQAEAVVGEALQGEDMLREAVHTFAAAVRIAEKAYGPRHPELARILMKAAAASAAHGKNDEAVALARRAADIDERNIRGVLAAGSEAQKKAYAAVNERHVHRLVSLHREQLPESGPATRLAMLGVLRHKGRVLDVLVDGLGALRRRLTPEDAALLDELSEVRALIATQLVQAPTEEHLLAVKKAEEIASELERKISERSEAFRADRAPITLDAVQQRVPNGALLVEIFLWRPLHSYNPQPPRYLAYALAPTGEPRWVELGPRDRIDAAAASLRAALTDPRRDDYRLLARQLDRLVMEPIRKLAEDSPQLIVSPDGALNLVPLGALIDERQRFLVETRSISYVTSGRDLLRITGDSPARSGDVIIANPAFGEPTPPKPGAGPLARAVFMPLPGTEQEAAALAELLPKATKHEGQDATKAALRALHGPRLLHVATHGFFLGEASRAEQTSRALVLESAATPDESPLLQSGLALAGANERDASGVLTALEAATLDLWGTKLVVLSACETGVGKIEVGEGVTGLRRALWTAGAESAVMSLWKVDDDATRDLMIEMYSHLSAGAGRAEALRRAQLSVMAKPRHAHPYFWASFIPVGDYRTLSGRAPDIQVAPPAVEPGPRGCACHLGGQSSAGLGTTGLALLVMLVGRRRFRPRARARARAPLR